MNDPTQYRTLAPGPSPRATILPSGSPSKGPTPSWKKRVSTACLACKRSKRKCSGVPPCDNCRALNRVCIFDETLDQRRRIAAKRTAEELEYHRDMLNDLFKVIRSAEQTHAMKLLEIIRNDATPEEIRAYIDEALASIQSGDASSRASHETTAKLKHIRHMVNLQGPTPSFRRKVMDVHFLCDTPPIRVRAKPWTTVTDDDDLVSHLVSLYFTWSYPFYAFLDRDVFVKHMAAGDLDTELCTPFLVNTLLANACHFSEFSEAYSVPGDVTTKGIAFLEEAERFWDQANAKANLATLQGTLLLYERYSMFGDDDNGYTMLNRAIDLGKALGFVGAYESSTPFEVQPADISSLRTAWGLYQVDTVVHTGFLKPNRLRHVNRARLPKPPNQQSDSPWVPYPMHRPARPSYDSLYFDEACTLSEIASDMSHSLFVHEESLTDDSQLWDVVKSLYARLQNWHDALPSHFNPACAPPPHVLLLYMRYHTLVITLFSCPRGSRSIPQGLEQRRVPENGYLPDMTITSSRAIANLVRTHRSEYGMSRSHIFALYAVNLALFALLNHPTFDILDPDFVTLGAALSIIASRSKVGSIVFQIFRQSLNGKIDHRRVRESSLTDELKDLFAEDPAESGGQDNSQDGDELDHLSDRTKDSQEPGGIAVCEMLSRYEALTLGKERVSSSPETEMR